MSATQKNEPIIESKEILKSISSITVNIIAFINLGPDCVKRK